MRLGRPGLRHAGGGAGIGHFTCFKASQLTGQRKQHRILTGGVLDQRAAYEATVGKHYDIGRIRGCVRCLTTNLSMGARGGPDCDQDSKSRK